MEPEPKRPKIRLETRATQAVSPLHAAESLNGGTAEQLTNGAAQVGVSLPRTNGATQGPSGGQQQLGGVAESEKREVELLRLQVETLRREAERREAQWNELMRNFDHVCKQVKSQKEEIASLRSRLGESIRVPEDTFKASPAEAAETLSSIAEDCEHHVQLQILQHPPTQAVYQRILRPFPTVAVVGASHLKTTNNLFVEVSLLRQHEQSCPLPLPETKNGGEKKHLIGGQLVQRSEWGPNPDKLVVVFRKLKILTTTAQQGGSFFVLKFILKRYVDNNFEVVPGVALAISDPMEVFSHTLYLKSRAPGQIASPLPFPPSAEDSRAPPKRAASPPLPQSRDRAPMQRNRSISLPPAFPPAFSVPNPNANNSEPVVTPLDEDNATDSDPDDSLESQARILQLLRRSGR